MNKRVIASVALAGVVIVVLTIVLIPLFKAGLGSGIGSGNAGPATRPRDTFPGESADTDHLPLVYSNDFVTGASIGWTDASTDRTPSGRPFLGQFGNRSVSFKLTNLPSHAMLRISFDLLIINTWDGVGRISAAGGPCGPDYVEVGLEDGPNLLRATFSTLPDIPNFATDGKLQTYPSPIPSLPNKMGAGASAVNGLGYVFKFNREAIFPMDGTYPVSMTIPHTGSTVRLNFSASGLQGVSDESWGVSNMRIEVVAATIVAPPEPQLRNLFETVQGSDATAAHEAFWQLVSFGDATVRFVEQSSSGFGIDAGAIKPLIESLDNLEAPPATLSRLIDLGPAIEPFLDDAARASPQLQETCRIVLREIEVTPIESPRLRRQAAASRLLYVINTPEAQRVQTKLAAAPAPGAPQPGTPEYDAEWKTRFDAAYRLQPGEVLAYVPPASAKERERFLAERHRRDYPDPGVRQPDTTGMPMIVRTRSDHVGLDSDVSTFSVQYTFDSKPLPARGLTRALVLLSLHRIHKPEGPQRILVPAALEEIDLPGDWVVRRGTPAPELLEALEKIIEAQTKRRVRFVEKQVDVPSVVVTGTYALKPDDSATPDRAQLLEIYADKPDDPRNRSKPRETTLKSLIANLRNFTGHRFVDETVSSDRRVRWSLHYSVLTRDRATGTMAQPRLDALLKTLAAQTSLTFSVESRPEDVLEAAEISESP